MKIRIQIEPADEGERLDRVLARHELIGSRAAAARLFADGAVSADSKLLKKSDLAVAGQIVEIDTPERDQPQVESSSVEFEIVHEDDHLLVVDKPAGLVVHPAPGHRSGTLSQALAGRAAGGDPARPGIVHRLDQDTSGLLVVARNDATLRALQEAIQRREVARAYTALVVGVPESRTGTIDAPLGRSRRDAASIAIRQDSDKDAITHFEVLESLGRRTLLEVRLETGRTHQIRVHLAGIHLPVSGDPQYGAVGDLGLDRQFLHASSLSFAHPATGSELSFRSELPDELAVALDLARQER